MQLRLGEGGLTLKSLPLGGKVAPQGRMRGELAATGRKRVIVVRLPLISQRAGPLTASVSALRAAPTRACGRSPKGEAIPIAQTTRGINMYDIIIIGAGVSGCACARELSRYDAKILVVEKEEDVCCGTSKANSAIVHAGYDAAHGSLMAKLNVEGSRRMPALAKELLKSDLLTVMQAVTNGTLSETPVEFSNGNACCVVMASKGYPVAYEKGYEIDIPDEIKDSVYVAGAAKKDGRLVTSGGRVLGVTAVEDTLEKAVSSAYKKVEKIHFDSAFYRRDIGAKALAATEEK